jgi:mRNA interferase RelE/StbE
MAFKIEFTKSAEKDFTKLSKKIQKQVIESIATLADNPRSKNTKKLKTPFDGYRIRSGDYRILFTIQSSTITIYSIKNRKDAYRL